MTECNYCGLKLSGAGVASAPLTQCPNCGTPIVEGAPERENGVLKQYWRDLWLIITQPTLFFRRMPVRGGISGPLAFALITHWIGEALSFLWRLAIGQSFSEFFKRVFQIAGDVAEVDSPGRSHQLLEAGEKLKQWLWGVGPVVVDPFRTLVFLFFVSFLVFLGARMLVTPGRQGAPREISYESSLRIVCFGLSPAILAGIPVFGHVLSWVFTVIVTTIGAKEVYRVGGGRALVIALFPNLLFLGIILSGFALGFLVLLKLFASSF